MTQKPSDADLRDLAQERSTACVSIYMPSHPVTPKARQDPIRFKNLLRGAKQRLLSQLAEDEAEEILKPALQLLDDQTFWDNQDRGLAVLIAGGKCRAYRVPIRFDELVVVSNRFHLIPLLPLATRDNEFYLLALSGNAPRLFQGNQFRLTELKVEGMPRSMADALKYDDPEKQLQAHTMTPPAGGKRAAMYHGHGVGKDDQKNRLLRYFREIDRSVAPVIRNSPAPVILATVEYYAPIYREAETHGHLFDAVVAGNPEHLDADKLHEHAWRLIEPHFAKQRREAIDKIKASVGTPRFSNRVAEILPAAHEGRVETLVISLGEQQWGRWDEKKHRARLHREERPGDEDLLDHAAIETHLQGGRVHCVECGLLNDGVQLAATLRA